MRWEVINQKLDQLEHTEGIEYDPFQRMLVATKEGAGARISSTVGRAVEYGEIKCSATVTIDCPQRESYIDLASEIAFRKALELANDGMSVLVPGIPRIGED